MPSTLPRALPVPRIIPPINAAPAATTTVTSPAVRKAHHNLPLSPILLLPFPRTPSIPASPPALRREPPRQSIFHVNIAPPASPPSFPAPRPPTASTTPFISSTSTVPIAPPRPVPSPTATATHTASVVAELPATLAAACGWLGLVVVAGVITLAIAGSEPFRSLFTQEVEEKTMEKGREGWGEA